MQKIIKTTGILIALLPFFFDFFTFSPSGYCQDRRYERYDMIMREISDLKKEVGEIKGELRQINKRFEDINKRFEDIDKRFEIIDKRFEDINKRLDDLKDIMIGIFGGMVVLVASVIAFAFWDRRTIIRRSVEESRKVIEEGLRFKDVINVLKDMAKEDERLEKIMKRYGFL